MSFLPPLSFEKHINRQNERVMRREPSWPVTKAVRHAIYKRDNGRCYYCGSTLLLSIDHKVPKFAGGSNHTDNLVTACRQCNSTKGVKPMWAFLEYFNSGDVA